MNWSAKDRSRSSPHYEDEGKLIQPIATRCVRAARSGRIEHDPRRTRRVVQRLHNLGYFGGATALPGPTVIFDSACDE